MRRGFLYMKNKIIKNIEPFNEFNLYDCMLHAIFSIINHFNRHVYPFLFKSTYKIDLHGNVFIDLLRPKPEVILCEMGIIQCSKNISEDIILDVKNALVFNRPIVIYLDCYYESVRDDAYMKNHFPHAFLIYGFDDSIEKFNIIEHKYNNSVIYMKRQIGYGDIINCYRSGINNLALQNYGDTYYEYFTIPDFKYNLNDRDYYIQYLDDINHKSALFENNLVEFRNNIPHFVTHISDMANLDEIIKQLSELINEKNKEKYILRSLFSDDFSNLKIIIDKIINEWIIIRGIIVKMKFVDKVDERNLDNIRIRGEEIYQKELELLSGLLDIYYGGKDF